MKMQRLLVQDEETLVSLCMLIPGENLRRAVARCVWFDVVEQIPEGQHMPRLKSLADPERLDDGMDWSPEDERLALIVVGYTEEQIDQRLRVHLEQRRRAERDGSELKRAMEERRGMYLPRFYYSGVH